MLTWVPAVYITRKHLKMLAESIHAAPEGARMDEHQLVLDLQTGKYRLFEWVDGCLVVAKVGSRLLLMHFCCHNLVKRLPSLVSEVQGIAADWECDKIETMCFDRRLTSAMQRLGAEVESTTLVLDVGNAK